MLWRKREDSKAEVDDMVLRPLGHNHANQIRIARYVVPNERALAMRLGDVGIVFLLGR